MKEITQLKKQLPNTLMNVVANNDITDWNGVQCIDSLTLKDKLGAGSKHSQWITAVLKRTRAVENKDYKVISYGEFKNLSKSTGLDVVQEHAPHTVRTDVQVYLFGLDFAEIVAAVTDTDAGHQVLRDLQGYRKAYQQLIESVLNQQALTLRANGINNSSSDQANASGFYTAQQILDISGWITSPQVIKRVAEYYMVPTWVVGVRKYYSLASMIESYRRLVSESNLKTSKCTMTYQHEFSGITFEHK